MLKVCSCIGAVVLFLVSAFFFFDHEAYIAAGFMALASFSSFLTWLLSELDNYAAWQLIIDLNEAVRDIQKAGSTDHREIADLLDKIYARIESISPRRALTAIVGHACDSSSELSSTDKRIDEISRCIATSFGLSTTWRPTRKAALVRSTGFPECLRAVRASPTRTFKSGQERLFHVKHNCPEAKSALQTNLASPPGGPLQSSSRSSLCLSIALTTMMITAERLEQLLEPYGVHPSLVQQGQILSYLDLLLRWNRKINLTAIRDPEECVTRHFGESLFIAEHLELHGGLLDIGSGAGFPGLALKIAFPALAATLLEPVAKKRAFLKEAVRVCGFTQVSVRADRLEEMIRNAPNPAFDFATMRAVGSLETLVPLAAQCLKPRGTLLLWLTREQSNQLPATAPSLQWSEPLPIPLTRTAEIWRGTQSH